MLLYGVQALSSTDKTNFITAIASVSGNNCGTDARTACSASDVTIMSAMRRVSVTVNFQIAASSSGLNGISAALTSATIANSATFVNTLKAQGGAYSSLSNIVASSYLTTTPTGNTQQSPASNITPAAGLVAGAIIAAITTMFL